MNTDLGGNIRLVLDNWEQLWEGLKVTLTLSAIVIVIGTVVGIIAGLILLYAPFVPRLLVRVYVDVIRGLPGLVTVFIIYYGLPAAGFNVDPFVAATIALSAFAGAQGAEVLRGGITSIPKTQVEAGMAIGLTFWPRLTYVILPQALPRMIPPWINSCVDVVKGTSLVALVSVVDVLLSAQQLLARTYVALPFYIAAAVLYIAINLSISGVGSLLMRRFSYMRYVR